MQCIAVSTDGVTFRKIDQNPVIAEPPEYGSFHFRDPKVWKHGNQWYMVVGNSKDVTGEFIQNNKSQLFDYKDVCGLFLCQKVALFIVNSNSMDKERGKIKIAYVSM